MNQKLLFLALTLSFTFAFAQVPPNDTVATAIDITATFTDVAVNTQNATTASSGDWAGGCAINTLFTRVYYKHTPTVNGTLRSEITSTSPTMNTSFVIVLTAANANATTDPELTLLSLQNSCVFGDDTLINTIAGQTYYIAIHNLDNATDLVFTVGPAVPVPTNNELANAIDITGSPYTDPAVSFLGADASSGGDAAGCATATFWKVYYKFTAIGDGNVTGTITTPAGSSLMLFFESSSATPTTDAELDIFVPGTAGCAVSPNNTTPVTAGTTYYIMAGNDGMSDFDFTADSGVLSVDEFENPNIISMFPTVASDVLNIHGVALDHIKVYDITGKQIFSQDDFSDATTNTISVRSLNSGLFFIDIISTNGKREVIKFLKE